MSNPNRVHIPWRNFVGMKWKSVSPEVKRRDSPKYRQKNYNFNELYEKAPPIDSIIKKFKEMERKERELQEELEYYRSRFQGTVRHREISNWEAESNRDSGEFHSNFSNQWNNKSNLTLDYYLNVNDENYFNHHNQIEHNYKRERESNNDNYYNSHKLIEDEEDELYFYGGGRKRKTAKDQDNDHLDVVADITNINSLSDYDPIDYASSDISSSWSSNEEVFKKTKKLTKVMNKTSAIKSSSNSVQQVVQYIKPKAYNPKIVDFDAPTIIKIPPNQIPNTWAHIIHNPLKQTGYDGCREILVESLTSGWNSELKLANSIQGILMRPPFNEKFSIQKWAKFMKRFLPSVLENGYLFIWVEREELADVIRAAEKYLSFKYVENLCWIKRNLGNRLLLEEGSLFYKSKMTLLILRRDPNNKCKLRHQRNPDCIFDFVGPGRMPDGRVYDVIETLLDGTSSPGPHLMHLWASSNPTDSLVYKSRKHWIRVIETGPQNTQDSRDVLDTDGAQDARRDIVNVSSGAFDEDFCNFIICEPTSDK